MLILRANTTVAGSGFDVLAKDTLLSSANGGVPWLVDLGWSGSYDLTTPVPTGKAVLNMVDGGANSSFVVAGSGPTVAGGGVDFSAVDTSGTYLAMPASVAAAISAGSQQFLFAAYFKLPIEADWATEGGQTNTLVNFTTTAAWNTQADIFGLRIMTNSTVKQLGVNRQTAIGASQALAFSPVPADFFGAVAQIAFYRDGTNSVLTVRTAGGRTTQTVAAGADNSETITALIGKLGILPIWGAMSADDLEARKFRLYRAWVEIPATSGRAPLTVLDADWDRNASRFS